MGNVPPERCDEIVHALLGTAKSINEVCTEEETNSEDVTRAIDIELFLCARCEWWCEHAEKSDAAPDDEPYCDQCED